MDLCVLTMHYSACPEAVGAAGEQLGLSAMGQHG
jgi:hypothetical protein